jgi:trehalose-phosphatase
MRHLFDCWQQVAHRVRSAGSVALFLDFDGTLAEFCLRPEDVTLAHATKHALARLASQARVRVCVVSGRRLKDIQARTGLSHIRYLGLHGWENGASPRLDPMTRLVVQRAKHTLANRVRQLPGIRLQDKGAVFSVHYRGASEPQVAAARLAVGETLATATPLRAIAGRLVWEILPRSIGDKGAAVQHQLRLFSRQTLPIYVGDDRTDEPAFVALSHGITIRVGPRLLTRAEFQLRGPAEVRTFLEKLARVTV